MTERNKKLTGQWLSMLGSGVGDGAVTVESAVMIERENMESLRREAETVVGARPGSGLGRVERESRGSGIVRQREGV